MLTSQKATPTIQAAPQTVRAAPHTVRAVTLRTHTVRAFPHKASIIAQLTHTVRAFPHTATIIAQLFMSTWVKRQDTIPEDALIMEITYICRHAPQAFTTIHRAVLIMGDKMKVVALTTHAQSHLTLQLVIIQMVMIQPLITRSLI